MFKSQFSPNYNRLRLYYRARANKTPQSNDPPSAKESSEIYKQAAITQRQVLTDNLGAAFNFIIGKSKEAKEEIEKALKQKQLEAEKRTQENEQKKILFILFFFV